MRQILFPLLFTLTILLTSCQGVSSLQSVALVNPTQNNNSNSSDNDNNIPEEACVPERDQVPCHIVEDFQILFTDSFERNDVLDPTLSIWRSVINERGTLLNGKKDAVFGLSIFSDQEMGLASNQENALYFYSKSGHSLRNLYLISNTFNMQAFPESNSIVLTFDHIMIDLEKKEHFHIEICNNTPENCGIGDQFNIKKINSSAWQPLYSIKGKKDNVRIYNGRNHDRSDWESIRISFLTKNFQTQFFTFRLNIRIDEGFKHDHKGNGLVDGVIVDNFHATAYKINEDLIPPPGDGEDDEIKDTPSYKVTLPPLQNF